jgi:1,4-dihydroxy-6-naphthoate synthase
VKLRVGISTCPNDTFAFHGLLAGAVRADGLELEFLLLDIEELNQSLARGDLDIAKASFFAAQSHARDFGVLPAGAAVGFGVGPLLVARGAGPPPGADQTVLAPGASTTAFALLRMLVPSAATVRHVRFDAILPTVARGEADAGVVIHEGRFTYREHGLTCRVDLGAEWERRHASPLPLGGLLARKSLGASVHARLTAALRASLAAARADRDGAFATMQRHARELAPEAIWPHVDLYVNDLTEALAGRGRAALMTFSLALRDAGLTSPSLPLLEVLGE